MPTIEYTGSGRYRVGGITFEQGDTSSVSEDLAEHLVSTGEFEIEENEDQPWPPDGYDPSEDTASEVREGVAEMEDPDRLRDLAEVEEAGKDRTTVLGEIDDRIDELED